MKVPQAAKGMPNKKYGPRCVEADMEVERSEHCARVLAQLEQLRPAAGPAEL